MKAIKRLTILVVGCSISLIITLSIIDYMHLDDQQPDYNSKYAINEIEKYEASSEASNPSVINDVVLKEPENVFEENDLMPVFTINFITEAIKTRINGISYHENPYISYEDLRYLQVSYFDFNGNTQVGELIVNEKVANDLIGIFKELYAHQYAINKIQLIDAYDADDNLSMEDNNTSAFNYRYMTNHKTLSNHAYGIAIDINPLQNPYISGKTVLPEGSQTFLNREVYQQGMIIKGDICYNAFISRGWTWGGDWISLKDYQHFEKKLQE
ncbi:MAG: M15 family metallopeptidase [Clostridia bacterium]|nr:M15 family metallopeptidase [Clostridia bacterium]